MNQRKKTETSLDWVKIVYFWNKLQSQADDQQGYTFQLQATIQGQSTEFAEKLLKY